MILEKVKRRGKCKRRKEKKRMKEEDGPLQKERAELISRRLE